MFIEVDTQRRFTDDEVRAKFPNISFPANLTGDAVSELGFAELVIPPYPEILPDSEVVDEGNVLIRGQWTVKWGVCKLTPEESRAKNPRIKEIMDRFLAIDLESIRPLRAVTTGMCYQEDIDKINRLEAEHRMLLKELKEL